MGEDEKVEGAVSARIGVVLPAAGLGERLGGVKKAFLEIGGVPLLLHSVRPFLHFPGIETIVVALASSDALSPPDWLLEEDLRIRVVAGGATRADSVHAALAAMDPGVEVVLIHDAARPFVTQEMIARCVTGVCENEGVIAGWPVVDTLKEVDADGIVLATPDRSRIRGAQTPQGFPREGLLEGYRKAREAGVVVTDDAQAFAMGGGRVRVVDGSAWNLKVTHPEDLSVAEFLLRKRVEP